LDVLMEMGNLTKQNHDVGVIVLRLLPRSGFIGLIRFCVLSFSLRLLDMSIQS
jgi:hypothetical protein